MYFTPKSSTTSEKEMGRVMCRHNPGVWVTSKYPCGARFSFRPFFANAPDCGRPYMDSLISTYTYQFFVFCLKLYCFMICYGNADRGMYIYSKRSNRVQRYNFFISTHICLELMVLMMMFHSILDVVRSAVIVVSSPG